MGYFDTLKEQLQKNELENKKLNPFPNMYNARFIRSMSTDILADLSDGDGIKKILTIKRYGITSEIVSDLMGYYGQVSKCYIRVYGRNSLEDIHRLADKLQDVLGEFTKVEVAEIIESEDFIINCILVLR